MTLHSSQLGAPARGRNIAVIGGGISGLAAAYLLGGRHRVTLFEAAPRLGGHARTVLAGRRGDQPVDTGFIVFNKANYPHLTALFADLGVPIRPSDMSFGTSIDGGRIEYGLRSLGALFAQRRNLSRPAFLRMIGDIFRFNARAEGVAQDDSATVGQMMADLKLGTWFQNYYLTPLCGAIWSTPPEQIRDFPARMLVQFFRNHALLGVTGQHQWYTVDGGSIEYVRRLQARLQAMGVALRPGCPVQAVRRRPDGVELRLRDRPPQRFDEVILACHSDDALRLLDRPTAAERAALGAIGYQDNHVVLHRDPGLMPRRRAVWSSWVYRSDGAQDRRRIGVSYWMNRLQGIPAEDPIFVTLNPGRAPRAGTVYDETTFRHPVFDHAALLGQRRLDRLQGQNRTWFAGAYTRFGFHEDGFASAVAVAGAIDRAAGPGAPASAAATPAGMAAGAGADHRGAGR